MGGGEQGCASAFVWKRIEMPKFAQNNRQIVQKQDGMRQPPSRTNWLPMVAQEAMTKTHHTVPHGIVAFSFSALTSVESLRSSLFCKAKLYLESSF